MTRDSIITSRLKPLELDFVDMLVKNGVSNSRSSLIRLMINSWMKQYDQQKGSNWSSNSKKGVSQSINRPTSSQGSKPESSQRVANTQSKAVIKTRPIAVTKQKNITNGSADNIEAVLARMQQNHQRVIANRKRFG